MRKIKGKNVVFATIWSVAFIGIGWFAATGGFAGYTGRRGRWLSELVESIRESIGNVGIFLAFAVIGLAIAAWVLFSKDEPKQSDPTHG